MDKNYRTIASRESRGLAGHSMGGYGTMRIGMKRPDVFSAIYALSSCCLNEGTVRARGAGPSPAEPVKTIEEASGNRGAQGTLARAAAWAPNPANPPLLSGPADEERRGRTRSGGEVGGQLARRDARSIRAEPEEDEGHRARHRPAGRSHYRQPAVGRADGAHSASLTRSRPMKATTATEVPERLEHHVLPFFSKYLQAH